MLELQRDAAHAIADEIKAKLTPPEKVHLARARPINSEAYEDYLKGYYYGVSNRDQWMLYLKVDPHMDDLRSDPRFQDLLRRMNFPQNLPSPK
jgi:hypothetical protein